jgi:hypothetical protein
LSGCFCSVNHPAFQASFVVFFFEENWREMHKENIHELKTLV